MVPFRVFDRNNKQMWQVINYHPDNKGIGSYLVTREDDSDADGEIAIIAADKLKDFKFIDFIEENESAMD